MEITFQQAVTAQQEGRLEEAERIYRAILKNHPEELHSNNNLGIILDHHSKFEEAEKYYKKAIVLKPDFAEAYNNLGSVLDKTKKFEEAKVSYKKAIEFKSDYAEPHFNLGSVFQKLNQFDEAETHYKKAIELKTDFPTAYNNLSMISQHYGKLEEAEKYCRKAIELKPNYSKAYNNLGNTLYMMGKFDEAKVIYKKTIDLDPNLAEAHNNLGSVLYVLNKFDDAEISYKKAIELKPVYAEAYNNLGNTLKKIGKLSEARKKYKQAIKFKPDYAQARMGLEEVSRIDLPVWHFPMMNDKSRNFAYSEAIKLAVDKGSLVLEIGTGSGLLSMMASANGAGEVITCETSSTIANIAKKIISKNGYEEKISIINKHSNELIVGKDLPRKADLIISEILSAEFVGEGVRLSVLDANKRLLKKNGTIIPQSGTIRISLLGNDAKILEAVSVNDVSGFDLSEFNLISPRKFSLNLKEEPILLSNCEDAFNINLYNMRNIVKEEKIIELRANQDGLCIGIIQWMKINVYKNIEYENKPGENLSHWPTPIYLFDEPVVVKKGKILKIRAFLDLDNVWFFYLP